MPPSPVAQEPLLRIASRSVVLAQTNIDTDQIIPARFLSTTERKGLGKHAFNDWRWLADGTPNPEFPFNRAENIGARIQDSLIGRDVIISRSPIKPKALKLTVGDHSKLGIL